MLYAMVMKDWKQSNENGAGSSIKSKAAIVDYMSKRKVTPEICVNWLPLHTGVWVAQKQGGNSLTRLE